MNIDRECTDVNIVVRNYDASLPSPLDKHAPSKRIYVVERPMKSHLTMASVMNNFFMYKIDNIRAEFPLLEANLPSYSFILMDSFMPMCPTSLYKFDPVTDTEL